MGGDQFQTAAHFQTRRHFFWQQNFKAKLKQQQKLAKQ